MPKASEGKLSTPHQRSWSPEPLPLLSDPQYLWADLAGPRRAVMRRGEKMKRSQGHLSPPWTSWQPHQRRHQGEGLLWITVWARPRGCWSLKGTRAKTRSQNRDHVSSRKEGRGVAKFFRGAAVRMSGVPQASFLAPGTNCACPGVVTLLNTLMGLTSSLHFFWRLSHLDVEVKLTYNYIIFFFLYYYYPVWTLSFPSFHVICSCLKIIGSKEEWKYSLEIMDQWSNFY